MTITTKSGHLKGSSNASQHRSVLLKDSAHNRACTVTFMTAARGSVSSLSFAFPVPPAAGFEAAPLALALPLLPTAVEDDKPPLSPRLRPSANLTDFVGVPVSVISASSFSLTEFSPSASSTLEPRPVPQRREPLSRFARLPVCITKRVEPTSPLPSAASSWVLGAGSLPLPLPCQVCERGRSWRETARLPEWWGPVDRSPGSAGPTAPAERGGAGPGAGGARETEGTVSPPLRPAGDDCLRARSKRCSSSLSSLSRRFSMMQDILARQSFITGRCSPSTCRRWRRWQRFRLTD